jgi:AraC-like DNA-binding protein
MVTQSKHNLDIQLMFCRKYYFADSTKWVSHAFPVLAMVTGGKATLVLNYKSKPEIPLKLYQPFFLPANLIRKPLPGKPNELEILALIFQVKIFDGIDLFNLLDIPMFFHEKISKRLCDLMLEAYSEETIESENWLWKTVARERILYEVVENILSSLPLDKVIDLGILENMPCLPAIKYLNKNFNIPLDIPKLMKRCSLSRTHFFRLFKKQTNSTPFEYIKNCRLQEAQNMLLCTNLSISEIGAKVGWNNQFHFSRIFKKEIGLSPDNYRQQFLKRKTENF